MMATSMVKNRYFDDDDESSTASIRTEDEYNANNETTATNREDHRNPSNDDDDEAAIAAQYAKKKSGDRRPGASSSVGKDGYHTATGSGSNHDAKRRKVDTRPKITMETILDPIYGISQLVTNLPVRMKSVTPQYTKGSRGSTRTGSSMANTGMSTKAAAQKYMSTLLQAYYDVIMNDWLQIPSLNTSSTTMSSISSNVQQQQILQDIFYKVETLGMSKGPMKDAITSLRHVHCRNPLLYNAIGVRRATTILQQYEQEQQEQQAQPELLQQEYALTGDADPNAEPISNQTSLNGVPQTHPTSIPTTTGIATIPSDTTATSVSAVSSTRIAMNDSKNNDSDDDDDDDEAMPRLPSAAPRIVPVTAAPNTMNHSDNDDDDDEGNRTTTVHPRNTNKRRYILEDSDEEE